MVSIKFKIDLPKKKFGNKGWHDEIAKVQRQTSVPRLRRLFQQTVFGWSTKPSFGWSQSRNADSVTISMYPTGPGSDIWELVNAGAKPHTITPRKNRFLSFRPGYRSATTVGSLQSRRAYRSGKYISRMKVDHPGFEGRNFTDLIAKEYENPFVREMQQALNDVAKK